jgi:arylsulfatase A-like enzyme
MEVPSAEPYHTESWPAAERNFAAMVTRMDAHVGRIVDTLRQAGKADNTLIIFTSDNGPHREGGHDPDFFDDNGPLRGIKRDLYEGGIRVPFLAWWPGRVAAGATSAQPIAFWDFLPTVCELIAAPVPAGVDGISYAPTLLGQPGRQKQHDYFYWEFHERRFSQAVRMGRWKAVRNNPGLALELYDLPADPGETRNLAADQPAVVARIEAILATARTESAEWPVSAMKPHSQPKSSR